jgi:hypothetical protein
MEKALTLVGLAHVEKSLSSKKSQFASCMKDWTSKIC